MKKSDTPSNRKLYTLQEVAAMKNVTRVTVYRHIDAGNLDAVEATRADGRRIIVGIRNNDKLKNWSPPRRGPRKKKSGKDSK